MKIFRTRQAVLSFILLILLLASGVRPGTANVRLVNFLVEPEGGSIFLEWETGSETDTTAFIIERRSPENAAPVLIDIVGADGEIGGSTYTAVDDTVTLGVTYWYDLYELTATQEKVLLATRSITAGQQVQETTTTTTATTATTTITPTATGTSPASAITPSPITDSVYPGPNDPVFTPTATLTVTPGAAGEFDLQSPSEPVTATVTLAPLPTIELIFPTPLARAGSPPLESAAILYDSEGELVQAEAGPSRSRLVLIGLVLLLWVGLGAWFVVTFRRMS